MPSFSLLGVLAVLVVLGPLAYLYAAAAVEARAPALRGKRICLLIAHPDDEAMFFAPAVQALTRPETKNHVKILCLSSGDAAGLGAVRKQELVKSALTLGLRDPDDVFVVESADFPDSMTTHWDSQKIATLLSSAFAPALASPGAAVAKPPAADAPPAATIDVLLTFDGGGVSGHPNHVSLYRGARRFVAVLAQRRPVATPPPVALYTLTTVPLVRKYASLLDTVPTLAAATLRGARATADAAAVLAAEHPPALVFLSGRRGLATAWKAMTTAHLSQMVWFRYGWITLSRYMAINDLHLETGFGPADLEAR